MKKKALSLALAMALCLGLTIPAFAVGETTVKDEMGLEYTLSKPVLGTKTYQVDEMLSHYSKENTLTVYLVPEGTVIKPVMKPGDLSDSEARKFTGENKGEQYFLSYEIFDTSGQGGENMEEEGFELAWPGVQPIISRFDWAFSVGGNAGTTAWTSGAVCFEMVEEEPPTDPEPTTPPAETIPASGTAKASTQTVTVDGKAVEFQMYALVDENGNGTNYIKLRDMAYVLNGTKAQFSVGYDNATKSISVASGAYEASGAEMTTPYSGDRTYTGGAQTIQVNGEAVEMTAITLLDDVGGGYNYFKLRDLGKALGFNVGWSKEAGVFIESDKPYAE